VIETPLTIAPTSVRKGDVVIVSGDVGRHGMAIMSVREGLGFEATMKSDSAPLAAPILEMLGAGVEIHCLRDLTRGGLASALNEIAEASKLRILIRENLVPVRADVSSACEMLGLDPLLVACEGRFVAFVASKDSNRALEILHRHDCGSSARRIGEVTDDSPALVVLQTVMGSSRVLDMPSGEQLPRIC
jgi:hydrogenase expression/formation protein HypE